MPDYLHFHNWRVNLLKVLGFILFLLLCLIQYPLWLGKGSMWELYELNKQLDIQVKINADYQKENEALKAEVDDLKKGTNAIEERARSELGMVKKDEIFFQVINKPK